VPLKDYTTSVPVSRTISQIYGLLVEAGARQILTEYSEIGTPTGIVFATDTFTGPRQFVLPVNAERVRIVLQREKAQPRYTTREHAERVAWRIMKDWVAAQLAIIRTEMVTLDEVMLPYMRGEGGRTVYELYRDQQLALPGVSGD
jgi:hypothetical protein